MKDALQNLELKSWRLACHVISCSYTFEKRLIYINYIIQRLQPWFSAFSHYFSILIAISVFSQKEGGGKKKNQRSKRTFFFLLRFSPSNLV